MATAPAPANVLRELAPPVEEADAPEAVPEEEDWELEDELAEAVEVPVEVMVVTDPFDEMVEVTVEATADAGQRRISSQLSFQTHLKHFERWKRWSRKRMPRRWRWTQQGQLGMAPTEPKCLGYYLRYSPG